MPQTTHRLVGVVELSAACDFETIEAELDQPSLPIALLDDGTRRGLLPEAAIRADLSHLCDELDWEYQQFVGIERNNDLAVL